MSILFRVRTRWSRDLQFRLITGLSALIILLLLAVALFTITRQLVHRSRDRGESCFPLHDDVPFGVEYRGSEWGETRGRGVLRL